MSATFVPSSPPSQEGTAPTPSTVPTVSTAVSGDELAAHLGNLSLSRGNKVRNDDPFREVGLPANSIRSIPYGLSPTADEFTPGRQFFAVAPTTSAVRMDQISDNRVFSSDAKEPKRAIRVCKNIPDTGDANLITQVSKLLDRIHVANYSVHPPTGASSSEYAECMLVFDDIREAEETFDICLVNIKHIDVQYLDPKAVARFLGFDDIKASNHEAEVLVCIMWSQSLKSMDDATLFQQLSTVFNSTFNQKPMALEAISDWTAQLRCRKFRVEFYEKSSVPLALKIGNINTQGFLIQFDRYETQPQMPTTPSSGNARGYTSDLVPSPTGRSMVRKSTSQPHSAVSYGKPSFNRGLSTQSHSAGHNHNPAYNRGLSTQPYSPAPFVNPPSDRGLAPTYGQGYTPGNISPGYGRGYGGRPGPQYDPRSRNRSRESPEHCIDVDTIKRGEDVRTTVMLRNIPNRITCHDLKYVLDHTSWGRYDFSYLRIDFARQCNVGYAFINFASPEDIIPFARAYQGREWYVFNSHKRAQISYATIQGRENLIAKFRNSSVMFEDCDWVPKLWIAGYGDPQEPDTGYPEAFPEPDNPSKVRRSMENADQIGLFVHPSQRVQYTIPGHYAPPANVLGPRHYHPISPPFQAQGYYPSSIIPPFQSQGYRPTPISPPSSSRGVRPSTSTSTQSSNDNEDFGAIGTGRPSNGDTGTWQTSNIHLNSKVNGHPLMQPSSSR